jgi:hypothetical protein
VSCEEAVVVTQCGTVEDLNDAVDPDERAGQGIGLGKADGELIWMWHVADYGERPDGQRVNGVVLIVADHEDAILAASAQQSPDLSPPHHSASRTAMSLLLSIRAWSSAICCVVLRRRYSPYAWAAAR